MYNEMNLNHLFLFVHTLTVEEIRELDVHPNHPSVLLVDNMIRLLIAFNRQMESSFFLKEKN